MEGEKHPDKKPAPLLPAGSWRIGAIARCRQPLVCFARSQQRFVSWLPPRQAGIRLWPCLPGETQEKAHAQHPRVSLHKTRLNRGKKPPEKPAEPQPGGFGGVCSLARVNAFQGITTQNCISGPERGFAAVAPCVGAKNTRGGRQGPMRGFPVLHAVAPRVSCVQSFALAGGEAAESLGQEHPPIPRTRQ